MKHSSSGRSLLYCLLYLAKMGLGPEQQQWHPSVALGDFVHQVSSLQQIVDMTKTSKLGSFDNDTIKRVMGWGLYIEEVS